MKLEQLMRFVTKDYGVIFWENLDIQHKILLLTGYNENFGLVQYFQIKKKKEKKVGIYIYESF